MRSPLQILHLIKFKLTLAVTLSASAGFFLYPGWNWPAFPALAAGIFLLAGGSAALNQYQERDRDARMARTRNRPLPSGALRPGFALAVSIFLCLAGDLLLLSNGWLPAVLGLVNLLLYNGLYTWLKTRTSFAVLPGGLVGAIPPVIGWTFAGGGPFDPEIIFVATLLFLWQMPHFWLLTIRYGEEYEAAGFKTLRRHLSEDRIRILVFRWTAVSLIFLLSAPWFGIRLPGLIMVILAIANLTLIRIFYRILFRNPSPMRLKRIFILSNALLTLILLGLIAGSVIG